MDDASNNTLFDWTLSSPSGQIYASNETVTSWTNVGCVDMEDTTPGDVNLTVLWNKFSMDPTGADQINYTFNDTYGDVTGFYVGDVQINNADNCPLTHTYVNDEFQNSQFEEVLLTTTSGDEVIFTSLLENNVNGFKVGGDNHDFQMLVGENGDGNSDTTPYYFYFELN